MSDFCIEGSTFSFQKGDELCIEDDVYVITDITEMDDENPPTLTLQKVNEE